MSKKDSIYHSYINEGGKKVSGMASYLHHMSKQGGVEQHEKNIVMKFFENFYDNSSDELRSALNKEARKSLFKVIKKDA